MRRFQPRHRRAPGGDWCHAETAMDGVVVDAGNLVDQPSLQLVHGHRRRRLRIIVAVGDATAGGARQQADGPHHRADQPLDMPAPIGVAGGR